MRIHTLCLSGDLALRRSDGFADALLLRVERRIPTDSIRQDQAARVLVPGIERIAFILELGFEDEAAQALARGGAAWQALDRALAQSGERVCAFDSDRHLPGGDLPQAARKSFRRWMFLRRAAASQEAFRAAWFGRHAELVSHLPEVDGYIQDLVLRQYGPSGDALARDECPVDGIAQLLFADEPAMLRAYASPERLPLRDDGRLLLDGNETLLLHGVSILTPAGTTPAATGPTP